MLTVFLDVHAMIEIPLDLTKHCIETETRRLYEHRVKACLTKHAIEKSTEAELELLKQALETFDFQNLRAGYPELMGGSAHKVTLATDAGGQILIMIDERIINP